MHILFSYCTFTGMNILILGSGGREAALAWKISSSPETSNLYVAPGNPGTSEYAVNLHYHPLDFEGLAEVILAKEIEMVIVGPEEPLVKGISDFLLEKFPALHVIGPSKNGAMLEGSKDFAKAFMQRHQIPTAAFRSFACGELEAGSAFIRSMKGKVVLKADGLAGGKGVIICENATQALPQFEEMLKGKFGEASEKVVVEEFLEGIEVSFFVLTDGKSWMLLPEAKDYKRILEGDKGLNTGGMGAVSPVPFVDEAFRQKVIDKIITPSIQGLQKENISYKGFLFIGLMNVDGEPYVIEYNCRMGDPETEAVMPRIESDLTLILASLRDQKLEEHQLKISPLTALTVVTVSEGYPESYSKGYEIRGLDKISEAICFHSGTKSTDDKGTVVSFGGRVLAITAMGKTIDQAREVAYKEVNKVCYENIKYRKDIGTDLLKY
jgi:phosphoribosylamine--glycine ligase